MATILKHGAPFPFGIAVTNPIYDIDPYKGPYESEADAMAVFPAALREVGRSIGIYTDANKRSVRVYNWEKDTSNAWVLVRSVQGGEVSLTFDSIILALGYTPMASTHAANGVTTTLIGNWNTAFTNNHTHNNKSVLDGITSTLVSNWNTAFTNNHTHNNKSVLDGITSTRVNNWDAKMDKVTANGEIVKVLGLDASNAAKNAEVVDVIGIWSSTVAPTENELITSFPKSLFVYAVSITPQVMYVRSGVAWKKLTLNDL